jgi:phage-related protein (TIGR01555 family)
MLQRFFRWLAGPPPAAPSPRPAIPRGTSFFSTDLADFGGATPEERRAVIQAKAFPVEMLKRSAVLPDDSDGSRITTFAAAMDSADTQGGVPSFKALYSLGGEAGMPDALAYWYASQSFIGYQMCALLAQNWLISKACATPVRDAVRKGFNVVAQSGESLSPELLGAIKEGNKRYRLPRALKEYGYFGRVYGIRLAYCKIETSDPDFYLKPFNVDAVTQGSYRGLVQIDPIWVVPELGANAASDPTALDFYEPTYWIVNAMRIHKSHFVIMRGPELPDILKPAYLYGGLPLTQRIYERVYAAERTANEAPLLAMTKRMTVFLTDMTQAVANEDKFAERMNWWANLRDNFGIKVADKHADDIQQFETSLADLDAVIMTQYQLVAAAAEMPATKLIGTTPKGFNSTGDYEEASYHEMLEQIQTDDLEPLVDRHHAVMMRSDIAPRFGIQPVALQIVWEPLDSITEKERAEINKLRADTDKILVEAGAIDGHDVRARLSSDETSGHGNLNEEEDGDAADSDQ